MSEHEWTWMYISEHERTSVNVSELTCFGLYYHFNLCSISLYRHYMTLQHAVIFPTQTAHPPHRALWTLQHAHTHIHMLHNYM